MHIKYGYVLDVEEADGLNVSAILDVHPDQRGDITLPDEPVAAALVDGRTLDASSVMKDGNGNLVRRIMSPVGGLRLEGSGVIFHSGFADAGRPVGVPAAASELPAEVLPFLLPSRCCPDGELNDQAWSLFRHAPDGWEQVQSVCDYIDRKLKQADRDPLAFRTAGESLQSGAGSRDDLAHVAVALCRALGIPARYCRGYIPRADGVGSACDSGFCAWFETWLDGSWWTMDPRNADPRIGRILVARGVDAADAPIVAGSSDLRILRLECFAEPIEGARYPTTSRERHEHWRTLSARTGS